MKPFIFNAGRSHTSPKRQRGNAGTWRALLCVSVSLWFSFASRAQAAEYEQKQGKATVKIQAEKIEDGRVEIRLSDELVLSLSVDGLPSLEVQPIQAITASKDWSVRRNSKPETVAVSQSRMRWQQTFHLAPLKPGDIPLSLTPLRFREEPNADKWEEVTWHEIPVRVTTEILNADLSELRDVSPPEQLPPSPSWTPVIVWSVLALVLLGMFVGTWQILRRRADRQISLPPHEWALRELERLSLPKDLTEAGVDRYHTHLSDILRKYLEIRFQLPALEQTTAEFLDGMRRSPQLSSDQQQVLRDFLERCDLVKFARAASTPEECRQLAEIARCFVKQTVTREPMQEQGESASA